MRSRYKILPAVLLAMSASLAQAQSDTYQFDIPSQPLADTLKAVADQTDVQVMFFSDVSQGKTAPALTGSYTVEQALSILLDNTDLAYHYLGDDRKSITVSSQTPGPNERMHFDIDAQPLNAALAEFSSQSGQQLRYPRDIADDVTARSVNGVMTSMQALERMLQGTGISYGLNESGAIVLSRPSASATDADNTRDARGRGVAVEEVIVTARKREESVQDIPISITAFSAADLKNAGIRGLGDMEGVVPGLNMGGGGNGVKKDSNPFIRGIGQRETKVTLDPAVGTYIDGIYIARTGGAMLDTIGMERIEILRGPQGTLFGRNTTGGAINATTTKPHPEFGASVGINVGNYGRSDASVVINGPLTDNLFGRLTIGAKNSDGYFTNINDNTVWGGDDRVTGIGQLRWLPTEAVTVDLLAESTRIRETPRPQKCAAARPIWVGNFMAPNPPDALNSLPVQYTDRARLARGEPGINELCQASADLPDDKFSSDYAKNSDLFDQGRYWVDTATVGLTTTWDIGNLGPLENTQFKSISAWRQVKQIADEDLDAVGAGYLFRIQPDFDQSDQYSQEFQFTGSALNQRLFFSTGLYYFQEETPANDIYRAAGIDYRPDGENYRVFAQEATWERLETDNESIAWFGQIDFDLTSQLQVSAGLRYTREERWSRYSKGYAVMGSMIQNTENFIESSLSRPENECVTSCSFDMTEIPIFGPMDEWQFMGKRDSSYLPQRGIPGDELSVTDSAWTPMVSLKYQFGSSLLESLRLDEAMAYVTYSEGFHAGGVTSGAADGDSSGSSPQFTRPCPHNPDEPFCFTQETPPDPGWGVEDPVTFEPERVKNYEIGLKMQGFDRRMQANIAVFYMDYTDMQVTSTGNRAGLPIPFVDNVGKAVIQGVEAEFILQPTANWRIMSNIAYTDADMKEWDALVYDLDPITGAVRGTSFEARHDEPMPRVPRWQAFVMTDYTFMLPNGSSITPLISARYTSEIYHGFDRGSYLYGKDEVTADPVTFLDARISYLSADQRFEVALWGKNLTDKTDYMVGGIPLVDVTGATGQVFANPRTFGLEMTYRFGAE